MERFVDGRFERELLCLGDRLAAIERLNTGPELRVTDLVFGQCPTKRFLLPL